MDGDGVQYIFTATSDINTLPPEITYPDTWYADENEYQTVVGYCPTGWKDDPFELTDNLPVQWVSVRKFRYNEDYKKKM